MGIKSRWGLAGLLALSSGSAGAEAASLFTPKAPAAPLVAVSVPAEVTGRAQRGSIFARDPNTGMFLPMPVRAPRHEAAQSRGLPPAVRYLLQVIASAEAGSKGYDAIQHGARRLPGKAPSQMTLAEIFAWIDATPGQPHAIGRYQFIPATLRRLVQEQGVPYHAQFSPQLQDQLAVALMQEAGLTEALSQRMPRRDFMKNLAKIWAGLPLPSGRSYYHGYAGNRATMSWASFETAMDSIVPRDRSDG